MCELKKAPQMQICPETFVLFLCCNCAYRVVCLTGLRGKLSAVQENVRNSF